MITRATLTAALAVTAFARAAAADTVVQLNVDAVLDGRSVSTVADGVVTPWSAGDGLDAEDGFVTTAVEAILKTQGKTADGKVDPALPDDGSFAANGQHPAIQLHFSNAAPTTSLQTHQVPRTGGAQSLTFDVPPATYAKLFLVMTSSYGAGDLTVTLSYAGNAPPTVAKLTLPDWGVGGASAGDPVFFNLIQGLHKWTSTDQEVDTPTHGITGMTLNPAPTETLTSVRVEKTNDAQVVFWGAAGVATSALNIDAGGDAAPDASAVEVGVAGAGGSADASGTAGSGGDAADAGASPSASDAASDAASPNVAGGGGAGTGGAGGQTGAAGMTAKAAGGGCALAPSPARGLGAASVLLIAIGSGHRTRRRA
ncbi:MAG TPA: hypothetical protein VK989_02895 [Polyangia bacterium]|nr:hypothetical protein [Polyangia bacterium]